MLNIFFSPSSLESRFRNEVREFLRKDSPKGLQDEDLIRWQNRLFGARLFAVSYPEEFGGRGLPLFYESLLQEELVRSECPQLPSVLGVSMIGPVLLKYGTAAQKERYIPPLLSGREIWCQGFSEPQAGSDLANLQCRAEVTADGFVLNGTKIWTSMAHIAKYCFALVRTGEERYDLSFVLVPMEDVKISPVRQITGECEFNQLFFDDVFVSKDQLVGEVNNGWKVAIATLMYERAILSNSRILQSETLLIRLLEIQRRKRKLMGPFAAELERCVAKARQVRALALTLGHDSLDTVPSVEGSLVKLAWSEHYQDLTKLQLKIGRILSVSESHDGAEDLVRAKWLQEYLYSRGRTVAAGSSEIQRNIIAERLIGLGKAG